MWFQRDSNALPATYEQLINFLLNYEAKLFKIHADQDGIGCINNEHLKIPEENTAFYKETMVILLAPFPSCIKHFFWEYKIPPLSVCKQIPALFQMLLLSEQKMSLDCEWIFW